MWIFENTINTRPILPDSIKYIRSDVPVKVSEAEREELVKNGVTTVIDLRTDGERAKKPCALMGDGRFDYLRFTVAGGNEPPHTPDEVSLSYFRMLDESFEELMGIMLNAKSNVLYFCNAGKDRTGIVTAVLLHRLGMPREYIVADYMKSAENLKGFLAEYVVKNPGMDLDVITPRARYMEEFLDLYEGKKIE